MSLMYLAIILSLSSKIKFLLNQINYQFFPRQYHSTVNEKSLEDIPLSFKS
jgi:hypothetical protein